MPSSLMKQRLCCYAAGCSLRKVFTLEGRLSATDHRGSSTDSLMPACYPAENNLLSPLDPNSPCKPASRATLHQPSCPIPPFLPAFNPCIYNSSHQIFFTFSFTPHLVWFHFYFWILLPFFLSLPASLTSISSRCRPSRCLRSSLNLSKLMPHLKKKWEKQHGFYNFHSSKTQLLNLESRLRVEEIL